MLRTKGWLNGCPCLQSMAICSESVTVGPNCLDSDCWSLAKLYVRYLCLVRHVGWMAVSVSLVCQLRCTLVAKLSLHAVLWLHVYYWQALCRLCKRWHTLSMPMHADYWQSFILIEVTAVHHHLGYGVMVTSVSLQSAGIIAKTLNVFLSLHVDYGQSFIQEMYHRWP